MLSSVIISPLLFSLFVQCFPIAGPDTLQITGLTGDLEILSQSATSSAPSFIALHSQPDVMSPSNPLLIRPVNAFPPAPIDPASSHVTDDSTRPLVMAYYPDWAGLDCPPEKINFTLLDWIDFAFALPNENFNLTWDSDDAPDLLRRLVDTAHAGGTKVKLSIGGWTGSKYFSLAVSTNASRETLARNILQLYDWYDLDGIDIDWEYPGREGASGNKVDSLDSQNFLLFLRFLRTILPRTARITAAAQTVPFTDAHGQSMADFADALDWVLLMNYDVWPSSSNPGPNAPLYDGCKNSTQPEANVVAAYNAWRKAGFASSQLVLGLPLYGYLSQSNATSLRTRSNILAPVTVVADSGQIQFRDLISQGALVRTISANPKGLPSFVAGGGFDRHWDHCSSTPYLCSPSAGQVITYDDTGSLEMKAQLARELGFLGANLFDVHGDTDQWDLVNSVRKGLGLS